MATILGFQLTWLFLGLGGMAHPLVQLPDAVAELQVLPYSPGNSRDLGYLLSVFTWHVVSSSLPYGLILV